MNDIQEKIFQLQKNGWSITALSEHIEQARVTVDKWKSGERYPANPKAILALLEQVAKKKRIPKLRRYTEGNRLKERTEK
jgi:ribosome-binding protein aMBF1 (putative translation factor)